MRLRHPGPRARTGLRSSSSGEVRRIRLPPQQAAHRPPRSVRIASTAEARHKGGCLRWHDLSVVLREYDVSQSLVRSCFSFDVCILHIDVSLGFRAGGSVCDERASYEGNDGMASVIAPQRGDEQRNLRATRRLRRTGLLGAGASPPGRHFLFGHHLAIQCGHRTESSSRVATEYAGLRTFAGSDPG